MNKQNLEQLHKTNPFAVLMFLMKISNNIKLKKHKLRH